MTTTPLQFSERGIPIVFGSHLSILGLSASVTFTQPAGRWTYVVEGIDAWALGTPGMEIVYADYTLASGGRTVFGSAKTNYTDVFDVHAYCYTWRGALPLGTGNTIVANINGIGVLPTSDYGITVWGTRIPFDII